MKITNDCPNILVCIDILTGFPVSFIYITKCLFASFEPREISNVNSKKRNFYSKVACTTTIEAYIVPKWVLNGARECRTAQESTKERKESK